MALATSDYTAGFSLESLERRRHFSVAWHRDFNGDGYVNSIDFSMYAADHQPATSEVASPLMNYTYNGDATLGSVDTVDFNLLAANFSAPNHSWDAGDFDYDSSVETVDFNMLAANFSQVPLNQSTTTWQPQDHNADGTVDSIDFNIFAAST